MRNKLLLCAFAALSVWHVSAQEDRRQAMITGKPGIPKCTIEVEVDVVADVEVRGTMARLHTLQGSPATWRRFECNQPMPLNPANFRFRGIDGRGRQTLIGDPLNTGVAVIRIEDPKNGREGYTFDLVWDGAAAPVTPPPPVVIAPPGRPPLPPENHDHDHDGTWDRDRQFGRDDAIHWCSESAEHQMRDNGYSEPKILDVKMDGDRDRGDWIYGTIAGRRGPRIENFGFACSVDWQARRIGAVSLRPSSDGYFGGDADHNRFSRERAMRACSEAVQDRLRRDGYGDFDMRRIEIDDRPGSNNDSIEGRVVAHRGDDTDTFEFSCAVDFDGGRIRSINVDRQWQRH